MHIGVLPEIECGEMETARLDGANQPAQGAAGREQPAAGDPERLGDRHEIGAKAFRGRVRFACNRRWTWRRLPGECVIGRGQTRVDAGDGAAVRLVAPRRVDVAASAGQRRDRIGRLRQLGRDRQIRPERVHLVQVTRQHGLCALPQRQPQRVRRDVRIAIAIAADPGPQPEEAPWPMRQEPLPAGVDDRQHRQQHVAEVGERDLHLVGDKQPFAAQRPRLPEQRDLSDDRLFDQIAVGRLNPS